MIGWTVERNSVAGDASGSMDAPWTWLRLVGEFAVGRGDRRLASAEVGSRKARTLLALLAVERGRVVAVDRVVDVLWGSNPPRRELANIATLVSRLRAVLGPDVVVGRGHAYRLGPSIAVDLVEAAHLVSEAETRLAGAEPTRALEVASRAVAMLGGGAVLQDQPNADWAGAARDVHVELLRRARHAVADAAWRRGDIRAACAAAEAAAMADPLDERAHRMLMCASHAAGEPGRALAVYGRLRATLSRELGVDPAPATRELHIAILRDQTNLDPVGGGSAATGQGREARGLVGGRRH